MLLSGFIYLQVHSQNLPPNLEYLRLDQLFGLTALFYLIVVMMAGPLYRLFPNLPTKNLHRASLGGLGISTFYLAFLHFLCGFFGTLKGFAGLPFLTPVYLIAFILGLIALIILAIMASISFKWAMVKLGSKWKSIQRLVYVAAIALLIHPILIGDDFRDFTHPTAFFFILAVVILILLYALSTYRHLVSKYPNVSRQLWSLSLSIVLIGGFYLLFLLHGYINGGHHH